MWIHKIRTCFLAPLCHKTRANRYDCALIWGHLARSSTEAAIDIEHRGSTPCFESHWPLFPIEVLASRMEWKIGAFLCNSSTWAVSLNDLSPFGDASLSMDGHVNEHICSHSNETSTATFLRRASLNSCFLQRAFKA